MANLKQGYKNTYYDITLSVCLTIFSLGFSAWLRLSKRPECKRPNWSAIAIAVDGHRGYAVPEQMIRWEFGIDIGNDNEIEAESKTFVVRKNKTKPTIVARSEKQTSGSGRDREEIRVQGEKERGRDVEKKLHEIGSAANGFSEAGEVAECRSGSAGRQVSSQASQAAAGKVDRWEGVQVDRRLGARGGLRMKQIGQENQLGGRLFSGLCCQPACQPACCFPN